MFVTVSSAVHNVCRKRGLEKSQQNVRTGSLASVSIWFVSCL